MGKQEKMERQGTHRGWEPGRKKRDTKFLTWFIQSSATATLHSRL